MKVWVEATHFAQELREHKWIIKTDIKMEGTEAKPTGMKDDDTFCSQLKLYPIVDQLRVQ